MDRPEVPLLAPSQTFFLRENLKLRLLGARLALLSRDQTSYKADLKAAREWIIRYYDTREKSVGNALGDAAQPARERHQHRDAGHRRDARRAAQPAHRARAPAGRAVKTLFWVIALFALAVGLVVAARYNDGYVLIVLPPYRVEIALNLLLVLLAGGFVAALQRRRGSSPARCRCLRACGSTGSRAAARKRSRRCSPRSKRISKGATRRPSRPRCSRSSSASTRGSPRCSRRARRTSCAPTTGATRISRARRRTRPKTIRCASSPRPSSCSTSAGRRTRSSVLKALPRKHTAALRLELKAQQQTRQWEQVAALVPRARAARRVRRGPGGEAAHARARGKPEAQRRRRARARRSVEEAARRAEARDADRGGRGAVLHRARPRRATRRRSSSRASRRRGTASSSRSIPRRPDATRCGRSSAPRRWLDAAPARRGAAARARAALRAAGAVGQGAELSRSEPLGRADATSAHLELARLHERLGNADAARRHYRESLELALAKLKE